MEEWTIFRRTITAANTSNERQYFDRHFQFLVGSTYCEKGASRELIWVRDDIEFNFLLTAVCKRWRSVCNNYVATLFGRTNANLDALKVGEKKIVYTG